MEKAKHSLRFQAVVDDRGVVSFAKPVPELQLQPGAAVTVTIIGGVLSKRMQALQVTDEEIERIGSVQYEDREHVVSFLSSQGALKKNTRFTAIVGRRKG